MQSKAIWRQNNSNVSDEKYHALLLGEFAGALNVWDIQEWLEEHPGIKLEGTLAPLKDLGDDANPVVVIVEP